MRRLLHVLTHNWKLKLLAALLAMLLWVVVSAEQETARWVEVPVQVQVRDPRWELLGRSSVSRADVLFVGPGREVVELAIDQPVLQLSVLEVEDSVQSFLLEPQMVRVPGGLAVRARDVRPGEVRLQFRRLASRDVPVRPQVARGPAPGRALAEPLQVRPATVRVRGPVGQIERLRDVPTVALDLSNEDSTFRRMVRLDRERLGGLRLETGFAEVSGRVEPLVERVLPDRPVLLPAGLQAQPATVDVRLRGTRGLLAALALDTLRLEVTAAEVPDSIPAGGVMVPLRVRGLPRGVSAATTPPAVRLLATAALPPPAPSAQPEPEPATPPEAP